MESAATMVFQMLHNLNLNYSMGSLRLLCMFSKDFQMTILKKWMPFKNRRMLLHLYGFMQFEVITTAPSEQVPDDSSSGDMGVREVPSCTRIR